MIQKEFIWWSQRDGWAHLYLFDRATGKLKNQITKGNWAVRDIIFVDEKERFIYFTAGGQEKDRDPYYRFLYKMRMMRVSIYTNVRVGLRFLKKEILK